MPSAVIRPNLEVLHEAAHPLRGLNIDFDRLLEMIGESPCVLIGEATHGTHEFYEARSELTKRLIVEKGFQAVALEADWPDAFRVDRYVRGAGNDQNANAALSGFRRFPTWMWRNRVVLAFVAWLRQHNNGQFHDARKTGIYGLDLYSMHASIEAVLNYLDRVDPQAARQARHRYGCFDDFGGDSQAYGYAASSGMSETCEEEVLAQLIDLQQRGVYYASLDGHVAEDEFFSAEQNARLVRSAEQYYRSMFRGRVSSWNLRDSHMMQTLRALVLHLQKRARKPRVVVWAHNSHLGDARYTQMGDMGELNLGQLVREDFGHNAVLIGFTSYSGTVTAASDWGESEECKRVRPALRDSYEEVFHNLKLPAFWLNLRDHEAVHTELQERRLERAIGVIYRPETERTSHYFRSALSNQFDAVIHLDETKAIEPIDPPESWHGSGLPETFPSGV